MTVYQRQQKIMEHIKNVRFSTIKELATLVWSSESSVRRDIKALESAGFVKQTYGGIVLVDGQTDVVPVGLRDTENSAVKESLAKRAVKHIKDGDTIFLDGSSTVRRIAKYISHLHNLKIVTNNVGVFKEYKNGDAKIYCTGGLYLPQSNICVGSGAIKFIEQMRADVFFFSSQAISNDGNVSDSSEEETALRQVMMKNSKKKIFLCDSCKIGQERTFFVCGKQDIDVILCNQPLPWEKE